MATIFMWDSVMRDQPPPDEERLSAEDHVNRGLARHQLYDYPRAIAHYTDAIRLNPRYTDAYYHRGRARYRDGDLNGAAADFTTVIRLNPHFGDAYYRRATIRKRNSDYRGAIADYILYLEMCDDPCEADRMEIEQSIRDLKKLLGEG